MGLFSAYLKRNKSKAVLHLKFSVQNEMSITLTRELSSWCKTA